MVAFAGFIMQYLLVGNTYDLLFTPLIKAKEALTCYGLVCV